MYSLDRFKKKGNIFPLSKALCKMQLTQHKKTSLYHPYKSYKLNTISENLSKFASAKKNGLVREL